MSGGCEAFRPVLDSSLVGGINNRESCRGEALREVRNAIGSSPAADDGVALLDILLYQSQPKATRAARHENGEFLADERSRRRSDVRRNSAEAATISHACTR